LVPARCHGLGLPRSDSCPLASTTHASGNRWGSII
jgi:hypothetical protein